MTKQEVMRVYARKVEEVEMDWADRHIPVEVMHVYLLFSAIASGDPAHFFRCHGPHVIDVDLAEIGKAEYLGEGPLTLFERDAARFLNDFIERSHGITQKPQLLTPVR